MIWKRIEIVLCAAMATGACLRASPLQAEHALSFPVHVPAGEYARPLPPLVPLEASAEAGHNLPFPYFWTPRDGLRLRTRAYLQNHQLSRNSPGLLGAMARSRTDFDARPLTGSMGSWSFGTDSWQAQINESTELKLGSSAVGTPAWSDGLQLGGISLNQRFLADAQEGTQWNYSLAIGAVDHSAAGAPGDLVLGPMAGSLAMSYDYSPHLNLTSHTEVASDLVMSGMIGQYDLGMLGRWSSGIARSRQGAAQGWRYRAMADLDLAPDVSLMWEGERHSDGYADIRRHAAGGLTDPGGRQRWAASWDAGRWGRWSGSMESVYGKQGLQARRFGISQQFLYSPNLRIGLSAEREVLQGDYDIGLNFTFPLY